MRITIQHKPTLNFGNVNVPLWSYMLLYNVVCRRCHHPCFMGTFPIYDDIFEFSAISAFFLFDYKCFGVEYELK